MLPRLLHRRLINSWRLLLVQINRHWFRPATVAQSYSTLLLLLATLYYGLELPQLLLHLTQLIEVFSLQSTTGGNSWLIQAGFKLNQVGGLMLIHKHRRHLHWKFLWFLVVGAENVRYVACHFNASISAASLPLKYWNLGLEVLVLSHLDFQKHLHNRKHFTKLCLVTITNLATSETIEHIHQ